MNVKQRLIVLVLALHQLPALAGDESFQQAVKAYNEKNYRAAYTKLESCLKKAPTDVNALYYEALCCYQLNDLAGARLRYQRIIQIADNSEAANLARTALTNLDAKTTAVTPSTKQSGSQSSAIAGATWSGNATQSSALLSQLQSALAGADTPPTDMASLPDRASFYFTKEPGGHMEVNVMINNHQVPAWFDTGAGALFYKDQLVAAGVDCNKAVRAGFTRGWAGASVPIYAMDAEVKLGTLTRKIKITFEESSTGLSRNLIGQTLIKGYQYEVDDKGGRIELKKSIEKTEQKIDSLYDVPLRIVGTKDVIQMEVNGRKVNTFIDTGASVSIISQATADQCGVESTSSQRLSGVGGDLTVGVGNARIRLGPISKDFAMRIGGSGGNCIGQDFMEGWRFKIDREHGLLRFFH